MSTVSISYSSLKAASNEAKSVAKKLGKYADSLYNDVYKKLDNYDGSWTVNLTGVCNKINAKIAALRSEQTKYETYASNLISLKEECESVDESVKNQVSTLTASFKETHGINNNAVVNAINYFFTSVGNSTAVGRWVGGISDELETGLNDLKSSIKEWFNFDGGKELIVGVAVGVAEVAIGVLAIAAAVTSGVGLVVILAGVIGGAITAGNGVVNIWHEAGAYSTTQNGDPATGKRRSQIDTAQDWLRSSFLYGADGEEYKYNATAYGVATAIDVVNIACTVVTVASSATNLLKKGYKWATGNASKLSDIKLKSIFSTDNFKTFATKLKTSATNGISEIQTAFQYRDWSYVQKVGTTLLTNAGQNLKSKYWTFSSTEKTKTFKSIKNMISVSKDLLEGDDIWDIALKDFVLPSATVFQVDSITDNATIVTENVTVEDFYGVLEKLSSVCDVDIDIDISVHDIVRPSVALPVLRAS